MKKTSARPNHTYRSLFVPRSALGRVGGGVVRLGVPYPQARLPRASLGVLHYEACRSRHSSAHYANAPRVFRLSQRSALVGLGCFLALLGLALLFESPGRGLLAATPTLVLSRDGCLLPTTCDDCRPFAPWLRAPFAPLVEGIVSASSVSTAEAWLPSRPTPPTGLSNE